MGQEEEKPNRQDWPKIYVPDGLIDLFFLVAKKHGYNHETGHLFIYQMLKELYGEEVEPLADYLELRWLDDQLPKQD